MLEFGFEFLVRSWDQACMHGPKNLQSVHVPKHGGTGIELAATYTVNGIVSSSAVTFAFDLHLAHAQLMSRCVDPGLEVMFDVEGAHTCGVQGGSGVAVVHMHMGCEQCDAHMHTDCTCTV